jgi:hypothetical protein
VLAASSIVKAEQQITACRIADTSQPHFILPCRVVINEQAYRCAGASTLLGGGATVAGRDAVHATQFALVHDTPNFQDIRVFDLALG